MSACTISLLSLLATKPALLGQQPFDPAPAIAKTESVVGATDDRAAELKEAYRKRSHELTVKLIRDIEGLGATEPPAYLSSIKKQDGRWSFSGSVRGFADHTIHITGRDIAETEIWHHLAESPPLESRTAIVLADKAMRAWFDGEETHFELQRISLVPLDANEGKWYWEAAYKVSRGLSHKDLTVAIRMDGKVLTKFHSTKQVAKVAKEVEHAIQEAIPNFAKANGLWEVVSSETYFAFGDTWQQTHPSYKHMLFIDGLIVTFQKSGESGLIATATRVSGCEEESGRNHFTTCDRDQIKGNGELTIDGNKMTYNYRSLAKNNAKYLGGRCRRSIARSDFRRLSISTQSRREQTLCALRASVFKKLPGLAPPTPS